MNSIRSLLNLGNLSLSDVFVEASGPASQANDQVGPRESQPGGAAAAAALQQLWGGASASMWESVMDSSTKGPTQDSSSSQRQEGDSTDPSVPPAPGSPSLGLFDAVGAACLPSSSS